VNSAKAFPDQPDRVDISIIICTHGRSRDLQQTLESLGSVSVPQGRTAELLVIENGLQDATTSVVQAFHPDHLHVRYLYEPTQSKSRALNRGLAEARGDVLIFCDDDMRFPSEWLAEMSLPILSGRHSAVAGGITIPKHLLRPWMTPYHRPWLGSTEYLSSKEPTEMVGGNMAIHRRVLEKVGGYDENLGGGGLGNCEDALFGRQVRKAGFPIVASFAAPLEHHFNPAKLQYENWVKAAKASGRSRAYLIHHYFHGRISLPRLKAFYLALKLALRKLVSRCVTQDKEGIAPWELSYRESIAMCLHYIVERKRKRNYEKLGYCNGHPMQMG
jgi:glycosyltransferase involved in cell wall biosynthesis